MTETSVKARDNRSLYNQEVNKIEMRHIRRYIYGGFALLVVLLFGGLAITGIVVNDEYRASSVGSFLLLVWMFLVLVFWIPVTELCSSRIARKNARKLYGIPEHVKNIDDAPDEIVATLPMRPMTPEEKRVSMLLHPANTPSDNLLRPASSTESDPNQLLRPSQPS